MLATLRDNPAGISREFKVASQENQQPKIGRIVRSILFASLVIILPGVQWSLFGWLYIFLPLVAFYMLGSYGGFTGKRLLGIAVAISFVAYLLLQNFEFFVFSFALLLSGYVLFFSAERHDTPAVSGLKSSLALAGSWIVIFTALSLGSDVSTYGQFLSSLDEGITEALNYYRQNNDISAETLVILESSLHWMKVYIPLIMPSILGSFILALTWFTMVLGNILLPKTGSNAPWVSYQFWQLPEKIIWLTIGAGLCTILPLQLLRTISINVLILLSMIYCFQGMSIAVFFMNKWKVPLLLRSFFYVMIVFQSFGTILLLIFGIGDVWFDFRKLKQKEVNQPK
jgi:uncharacterized protein YybS (DUF2232 family)